jgi:NAD(P)-dependent dehydrogenase (short-subunit alcohol dehydrogenase family)
MNRFTGQRAVIIGGGSGIGLASALAFLSEGAEVTIAGRTAAKLEAACSAHAGLNNVVLDASNEAAVIDCFALLGPIDHLVLCANAGGTIGRFEQLDGQAVREYFNNKLWAYLNSLKHAARIVRHTGSITLVNGAASQLAAPMMGALAAVNGALDAVLRPLALELAPRRLNAVSPGVIDTPYWDKMETSARESFYQAAARSVPLQCIGQSSDIAEAICFFAANRFVTGTVLLVDGGRHLTPNLA